MQKSKSEEKTAAYNNVGRNIRHGVWRFIWNSILDYFFLTCLLTFCYAYVNGHMQISNHSCVSICYMYFSIQFFAISNVLHNHERIYAVFLYQFVHNLWAHLKCEIFTAKPRSTFEGAYMTCFCIFFSFKFTVDFQFGLCFLSIYH